VAADSCGGKGRGWGEEDSCVTAQRGWVGLPLPLALAQLGDAEQGRPLLLCLVRRRRIYGGGVMPGDPPPRLPLLLLPREEEEEDPYGNYGGDAVGLLLFFNPRGST
jgi:hypothetical protein